jgi:hypothetical protein
MLAPPAFPVAWVAFDFEWYAAPGALPVPRVLTAIESATGRVHRYGEAELRRMSAPPFPIGSEVVCCAYSLAGDMLAWRVLWPNHQPSRRVCIYAEHRVRYNAPAPNLMTTC